MVVTVVWLKGRKSTWRDGQGDVHNWNHGGKTGYLKYDETLSSLWTLSNRKARECEQGCLRAHYDN